MASPQPTPSLTKKHSIPPSWYNLNATSSGTPYITLPAPANTPTTLSSPSSPKLAIYLTPFKFHDGPAIASVLSIDSINNNLINVPKPYTLQDAEFWIGVQLGAGKNNSTPERALELQAIRATDPERGEFTGAVSLMPCISSLSNKEEEKEYELGYYLSPSFHCQGIMRNAVLAILAWAVREKGVKRVIVNVEAENVGSRRIVESLEGFVREEGEKVVDWPEAKGGGRRRLGRWIWRVS